MTAKTLRDMALSKLTQRFTPTKIQPLIVVVSLAFLVACSKPSYSLAANPIPYVRYSPTEYYLFLPSSYSPETDWPLFVGIHGSGRDGTQCLKMWQSYAESEGFVLVCPSLGDEHGGWYVDEGERDLDEILRQVRKDCRVQKQIFLAGFSAGAEFAQVYALDHPKSIKAVAILSSGNYYEPSSALKDTSFLIVIGDQDNSISVKNAQVFADFLEQKEYSVELDILPGVKHEITPQAEELTIRLYNSLYGKVP
jgi:predicted esterase